MKCKCGRRMSKHANQCKKCYAERMAEIRASLLPIVTAGVCPKCGRSLKRNSSLAGWYQCEQFGAEMFRADPTQPSCEYQLILPED